MHIKKQLRSTTMSSRSCACPRSTTPIIMRLCLAGGRSGPPSIYVYTRIKYWRIFNLAVGWSIRQSAKFNSPPNIPAIRYFIYIARAGLTGESRPRNDDVMPMRLAHTMVIDRIQLAVYCLSNCFAGKSLTCFAPRSYRYKHPQ